MHLAQCTMHVNTALGEQGNLCSKVPNVCTSFAEQAHFGSQGLTHLLTDVSAVKTGRCCGGCALFLLSATDAESS